MLTILLWLPTLLGAITLPTGFWALMHPGLTHLSGALSLAGFAALITLHPVVIGMAVL